MTIDERPPREVLAAWSLDGAPCTLIASGHINRTFRLDAAGGPLILQRVNKIFAPEIHLDIEAITGVVASAGLCTPRLVRAGERLWIHDGEGAVWRVLTCVEGETLLRADSPPRCFTAGRLLGRFHRALWGYREELHQRRLGVHDTPRHLTRLRVALTTHAGHRRLAEVQPLAEAILAAADGLALPAGLPDRVVHGDPKISNIIFAEGGEALALVDLDTIARMPIALELGDALRSWCSPLGEEVEGALELPLLAAALAGYAEGLGPLPSASEREAIPAALELIAVELAARFCTDSLEESYFRWDPARYASATDHNLARARSQLALARSVHAQLPEVERLNALAWQGGA